METDRNLRLTAACGLIGCCRRFTADGEFRPALNLFLKDHLGCSAGLTNEIKKVPQKCGTE
ncbi:hypothetical protein A7X67_15200 [Clostridium sp. W14A]|nr:hypothetical protein A7X67_15200 [Clostridium sp. W14A]